MLSKTLSFVEATKWYHHLHTEKLKHVKELRRQPGIYKRILQSKLSVGIVPVYLDETRIATAESGISNTMKTKPKPSLWLLLDKHRFSRSSDPRDKVYAFVGLADRDSSPFREQPDALAPDYNLSVQEVYIEVAKVLMSTYESLAWLSHVEDPSQRRILNLLSWVPDLSTPLDPYPLRFRGPGFWRAAGSERWRPDTSSMTKGELSVQGYKLDQIIDTSMLLNESEDPSAAWASIIKLALSLHLPYPDPGGTLSSPTRFEVLWRTLTTNLYSHKYPAPNETGAFFIDYILNLQIRHRLTPWSSTDEFQPHHSPMSDNTYSEWRTLLELEPPKSPYSLAMYSKRLTTVVESMFSGTYSPIGLAQLQHELDQSSGTKRRLFMTSRSFVGTGLRSLRRGDEIWILHRGGLPFMLRSQPNGNYHLVGESFVYGVMHGELLQMNLARLDITIE